MRCKNCGFEYGEQYDYCPNCGTHLEFDFDCDCDCCDGECEDKE
mgnify:CR=1 FL=1